jgi:pyrimidine-nucleoside phosphorylase
MSKKLAEGIDGLVLDVKTGNGAFMREFEDSKKLAEALTAIGRRMGKRVTALITDMNQPLGRWVGNAVETFEAIECLQGNLEGDFAELNIELAAQMIAVGGIETDLEKARQLSREAVTSGAAIEKFKAVIAAQGGDPGVCDNPKLLPQAAKQETFTAARSGFVAGIETDEIGRIVMDWGGGRRRLEDKIDYTVGLHIHAKLGDAVKSGQPLATAYFNDQTKLETMRARLLAAYRIENASPALEPIVKAVF